MKDKTLEAELDKQAQKIKRLVLAQGQATRDCVNRWAKSLGKVPKELLAKR